MASAACRLAPPIRPPISTALMPVSQVPSAVVPLPWLSCQPRSWYRAGVRSRRRVASRSALAFGSISAFGVMPVSKCENDEPVASTVGAYSFARPDESEPAKVSGTYSNAMVAPGMPAFRMAPSAWLTLIVGMVAVTEGSSLMLITPVVLLATTTAVAPASSASLALISKAQVPRSTTATLPAYAPAGDGSQPKVGLALPSFTSTSSPLKFSGVAAAPNCAVPYWKVPETVPPAVSSTIGESTSGTWSSTWSPVQARPPPVAAATRSALVISTQVLSVLLSYTKLE